MIRCSYTRRSANRSAAFWARAIATGFVAIAAVGCQGSAIETGSSPLPTLGQASDTAIAPGGDGGPVCSADSDCSALAKSPCLRAICQPNTKRCVVGSAPQGASCDDGDPCSAESLCDSGDCRPTRAVQCPGGGPCTVARCDVTSGGCVATPRDGLCDDGNPCTAQDRCQDGGCHGGIALCECATDGDCAASGGKNACVQLQCSAGTCVVDPAKSVVCPDGGPCATAVCDPATGNCSTKAAADKLPCSDDNVCTAGDFCSGGECVGGATIPCGKESPCIAQICDPKLGCAAELAANGKECDDGSACTKDDVCAAGVCSGTGTCSCGQSSDCATSDPTFAPCLGSLVCSVGVCVVDIGPAQPCQDAAACQISVCKATGCVAENAGLNAPCDDGNACTLGDKCSNGGFCQNGKGGTCDDGNDCTLDTCDLAAGCTSVVATDGKVCDDGSACTTSSTCRSGSCTVGVTACDDNKPCTFDWCDPAGAAGDCVHVPLANGAICDDNNACSTGEVCDEALCVAASIKLCDDANPCTDNLCTADEEGELTCKFVAGADGGDCDDGTPCTAPDACFAGACTGPPGQCECLVASDCAGAEDGDLCNGTLVCAVGKCVLDPLTVVVCDTSSTPCAANVCQPKSGQCIAKPTAGSGGGTKIACNDGNACTDGEVCLAGGACGGGKPLKCDDGDGCTVDLCDALTGCTATAATGSEGLACEDGNPCTKGDACGQNGCNPGKNTCQCSKNADCSAFDDGDVCNGGLVCEAGACVSDGQATACEAKDGGPCETYRCISATGACGFVGLPIGATCSDEKPCAAQGFCDADTTCKVAASGCDDGNPCTTDACNADAKTCSHTANSGAPCSDGDACTSPDVCSGAGACVAGKDICACSKDADCPDDGNLCNGVPKCVDATCGIPPTSVVSCDANNNTACQTNTCDTKSGDCALNVQADGSACDDGDACSSATTCSKGTCGGGNKLVCDDANPCTSDACSPASGCIFLNNTLQCDDGNACTSNDRCTAGVCVPGPNACDCTSNSQCSNDANACNGTVACIGGKCQLEPQTVVICDKANDDSCRANLCDEKTGKCALTPFPEGTNCDDSSVCTSKDRCQSGICKGDAASCDDNNPCSTDVCDAKAGCTNTAINSGGCDDQNACTTGESCQSGVCGGGTNTCGVCQTDQDCASKDDGNACNGVLECAAGSCKPKADSEVTCADTGDPCTNAVCQPATGTCQTGAVANGAGCDDKNACTPVTSCQSGVCVGAAAKVCNDENSCTKDSCDPASGCVFTPQIAVACDDNNSCTSGDVCLVNGTCSGLNSCDCQADADCAKAEDGDACNGTLVCEANKCVIKAGSVVVCDAAADTPCKFNTCAAGTGQCAAKTSENGASCDDGSACTAAGTCQDGTCKADAVTCDDGNSCTTDSCDAKSGCVAKDAADGAACEDGEKCTAKDSCSSGVCVAGSNTCQCKTTADCGAFEDGNACNGTLVCSDGGCAVDLATVVTCANDANPCTDNACDAKTGTCAAATQPDGSACGGAVLCGGSGTCQKGACDGAIGCSDGGNPCVTATCDGKGGCATVPAAAACDDGDVCTTADKCDGGKCVGTGQCNCSNDVDCVGFDDGDRCNGLHTCQAGQCKFSAATIVTCAPSPGPCATISCQSATGKCVTQTQPNGATCNDGDACTSGEQCVVGKCSGTKVDCDDSNTCTTDSCDASSGCKHAATSGSLTCDDGDPCTTASACLGGTCTGFFNQCTCNTDSDCADDNDKCNGVPSCQAGTCKPKPGTVVECPDGGVVCFANTCNPASGSCSVQPEPSGTKCDDANACTAGEVCTLGKCVGINVDCNDDVSCTADSCDNKTGCKNAPDKSKCSDGNVCTTDECDETTGCKNIATIGAPCDDGSTCTVGERCNASPKGPVCNAGVELQCNDDNPCTTDACGGTGCTFASHSEACDDGSQCTSADKCSSGKCAGTPKICDDSDPCTLDTCAATSGVCAHTNNDGGSCDDGDACTAGSKCTTGTCGGGTSVDCNDGNLCTTDSCDKAKGCVSDPSDVACDDKNPCTIGDKCSGGFCAGGAPKSCDDGNSCTNDKCNDVSGQCENVTGSGTCDDNDPCTTDSCDVQTGKCQTKPAPGNACDDGNACTSSDVCNAAGNCVGTGGCDDGNSCTDDACDDGKCSTTANSAACDDGNACTTGDVCKDGACTASNPNATCCSKASDCDDSYACTTDVCTDSKCVNSAVTCKDDGNDCTVEACKSGTCSSFVPGEFAPVSFYAEDFDDNVSNGMAITSDNKDVAWHISTRQSASNPRALHAANLDKGTYDFGKVTTTATLPPVQIGVGGSALLRFKYRATFGDAGCSKDVLTVRATAGNKKVALQLCDTTNGFVTASLDLGQAGNDLRGEVVTIAFDFSTTDGANNNAEGVYIDDVEILGTTTGATCCKGATDCADSNQCTFDACDAATGACSNKVNAGGFCDDGSLCTAQDVCTADAQCTGAPKSCSDGNTCTADECDPATGKCENPKFATFKQDFETDLSGFSTTSSNPQVTWQTTTKQPSGGKQALYVGNIAANGTHSYNFGPTVATATYKSVSIPASASKAFVRFKYRFANAEGPGCVNQPLPSDRLQLLVNGQTAEETCTATVGYEQIEFDLKDHIGKSVTLGLRFIANLNANNGEGGWFDDWEVGWTCQ